MKDDVDWTRLIVVGIMRCSFLFFFFFSIYILEVEPTQFSDILDMEPDRKWDIIDNFENLGFYNWKEVLAINGNGEYYNWKNIVLSET